MLSISINGTTVQEPIGLDELSERIYFNSELAMYLNKLEGDLTFTADGYNILRGLFNSSVCSLATVVITDDCGSGTYEGIIFLNDVKWDLSKCTAECSVVSDKFIQQINNNKGIKVQIGVGLSKNLETISSTFQDVIMPDPTGTTHVTVRGYRIFDVFNELVQFMTDGDMTFVSDYFDYVNPASDACYDIIVRGGEMRDPVAELTPYISYADFFNDMNKLHNLAGVIEGDTLRIEPKEYFRQQGSSVTLSDINEVFQESNREQFYASIKMGSAKVADGYGYLIKLSYNGFQKEQFFLQGECNIDNELDLELQTLVTDTNIIQDVMPVANGGTANDEYDEDSFVIHVNSTNTAVVTISPLSSDYFYNEYYTNRFCSERWSSTYPFSILQLLETLNPLVRATLTTDQTSSTSPNQNNFSPDNDSTGGNYDTGGDYQIGVINTTPTFTENIGYFEAPTDMVVTFDVDFYITGGYYRTTINHVDSSGNIQTAPTEIDINPFIDPIGGLYDFFNYRQILGGTTLYMPSGTRAFVKVDLLTAPDSIVHSGGRLEVVQTGAFGGIYKVINENNAFVSRTNFEYPISGDVWRSIKAQPYRRIQCTYIDGQFSGYPIDITRNIQNGNCDVNLYQRKQDIIG